MSVNLLPLFPLHTVLFPRMPLRLHAFEERYKQMISRCLEEGRPFGVVLIREGGEVGPPPTPESVGTMARIVAVEALLEGRMNLLTEGVDRFRLLDYATGVEPYLVGVTEPVRDIPQDAKESRRIVEEIGGLFRTYFGALTEHAGVEMPEYDLPADPEEFSFVIAAVLQVDPPQRQRFLEMTDTLNRLREERDLLRDEIALVRRLEKRTSHRAEKVNAAETKPYFSPN
jgi:Lon protease-like protein